MRTLIIEDVGLLRNIMIKFLNEYGPCHIAENGLIGIEKAQTAILNHMAYDLICLDIMMPEKNGLEVLKNIRDLESKHPEVKPAKIIMITVANDEKTIAAARKLGCEDYLLKPANKTKVIQAIRRLGLIQ